MSRYMDKNGFQRKDWGDSPKEIRKAEQWIQHHLDRGATIPEVWWAFIATFTTAFENVRYERVQAERSLKKKKRAIRWKAERLQGCKCKTPKRDNKRCPIHGLG